MREFVCLCVGVGVFVVPQDCLCVRLLFGFATFLYV